MSSVVNVSLDSIVDWFTSINMWFIIDYECLRPLGSHDNDCDYKAADNCRLTTTSC